MCALYLEVALVADASIAPPVADAPPEDIIAPPAALAPIDTNPIDLEVSVDMVVVDRVLVNLVRSSVLDVQNELLSALMVLSVFSMLEMEDGMNRCSLSL